MIAALGLAMAGALWAPQAGAENRCTSDQGCVLVLRVAGLIDPVMVDFVEQFAGDVTRAGGYVATVIELNSDGVVLSQEAYEEFVRTLQAQDVPVSVWVGTGASALGAAAQLPLAFSDSAMGTGSRIGEIEGPYLSEDVLGTRAKQLYQLRGRTLSAGAARDAGLVKEAVPTVQQYVAALDGVQTRKEVQKGRSGIILESSVVQAKPDLLRQALHTVSSPAVAYLLLACGLGLLIFEFFTAGVGVAGVIGALAALGAGYGLGNLPIRTWALVLIVGSFPAFIIDIQAGVQRFWTAVGSILWVVGSVFLFDGVHLPYLALATGLIGLVLGMVSGMPSMIRSRFGTPTIGRDWMIGEIGEAQGAIDPDGVVKVGNATWRARANRATPLTAGEPARVVAIDGLTLEVEPLEGAARDYRER